MHPLNEKQFPSSRDSAPNRIFAASMCAFGKKTRASKIARALLALLHYSENSTSSIPESTSLKIDEAAAEYLVKHSLTAEFLIAFEFSHLC